jgi:hypothetical protein
MLTAVHLSSMSTNETIVARTDADNVSQAAITRARSSGIDPEFWHTIAHFSRTEVYCFCSEVLGFCLGRLAGSTSNP